MAQPDKSHRPSKPRNPEDRTIRDDENYATDDFMKKLKISYPTYVAMVDAGLPVRTFGRYRRISGYEFNRWMETQPLVTRRDLDHTDDASGED